jgi:hypothetical protein
LDSNGIVKRIKTYIEHFGVPHYMQNQEAFEKNQLSSKKLKLYFSNIFNKSIAYGSVVGELTVIKFLENYSSVIKEIKRGNKIKYWNPITNKESYFHVDYLIEYKDGSKQLIEPKGIYWYGIFYNGEIQNKNKVLFNLAKKEAMENYSKEHGYLSPEMWIVEKDIFGSKERMKQLLIEKNN